jgi:hypothetical protein
MSSEYYTKLLECLPPPPKSPLGNKPLDLKLRITEAARLTELMINKRPFCFLRMGDMDLAFLLEYQNNSLIDFQSTDSEINGTIPKGDPGIGAIYAERLQNAFIHGDYVDFHERLYPMQYWLPLLNLPRSQKSYKNPNSESSYLSLSWLEFEFSKYCNQRNIGFAGAEAKILQILSSLSDWQNISYPFWDIQNENIYFHQIRDNGQNLDKNLDLIKKDLSEFIISNRIDTLFLSLGGGAKILCYELSREHNICTFDFGSMLRALTYSACDGNRAARSTHSPFLFRVPFDIFMDALEKAFPNLKDDELLAKAHAQLILELQIKEIGWTHTAWEFNFSAENKYYFYKGYKSYLNRYKKLRYKSNATRKELKNFLFFCGKNKLTMEGYIYYLIFLAKSSVRKILNSLKIFL